MRTETLLCLLLCDQYLARSLAHFIANTSLALLRTASTILNTSNNDSFSPRNLQNRSYSTPIFVVEETRAEIKKLVHGHTEPGLGPSSGS